VKWAPFASFTKTGNKYWVRVQGQPIINDKGETTGYFALEENITDKKEAELRFRNALEKIGDNVWEHDFETGKTYFSKSSNNLLGQELKVFSNAQHISEQINSFLADLRQEYLVPSRHTSYFYILGQRLREGQTFVLPTVVAWVGSDIVIALLRRNRATIRRARLRAAPSAWNDDFLITICLRTTVADPTTASRLSILEIHRWLRRALADNGDIRDRPAPPLAGKQPVPPGVHQE